MSDLLCDYLLRHNLLAQDDLDAALQAQEFGDEVHGIFPYDPMEKVLLMRGLVDPRELAASLCKVHNRVDYVLVGGFPVHLDLAARVGHQLSRDAQVLPLVRLGKHQATVLTQKPMRKMVRQRIAEAVGCEILDLPVGDEPIVELQDLCFEMLENRQGTAIRLGDILIRDNLIEQTELERAVIESREAGVFLSEYLARNQIVDETRLYQILCALAGRTYMHHDEFALNPFEEDVARQIAVNFARHNGVLPLRIERGELVVGMIDPMARPIEIFPFCGCNRQREVGLNRSEFIRLFQIAYEEPYSDAEDVEEAEQAAVPEPDDEELEIYNPAFLESCKEQGILTQDQVNMLEGLHGENTLMIMQHMAHEYFAPKELLGKIWGDTVGVAYLNLDKTLFNSHIVQKLPEEFARRNGIILVFQFGPEIAAATMNPTDKDMLAQAEAYVGHKVMPVFSLPFELKNAIDIQYRSDDSIKEMLNSLPMVTGRRRGAMELEDMQKMAGDEAVIEFSRALLLLGLKLEASDIHIEPREFDVRVRYRKDGQLQERMTLSRNVLAPLVSRLKIMADVDIMERRLPQDGRISLELQERSIDFRFSTVPTIYGEKIVLRILGQLRQREVPDLADLGFSKRNFEVLKRCITRPNGIFFVTGPTGSGKSTTLYGAIKEINRPDVNIMTSEDPVEYRLSGINQVQIQHNIGLDFARTLRSFLRQDPDIILVGEIRDLETAKISTEAALTGHLVFGTLHTNSALQAITRLIEIGVESHIVSPAIVGVMAQRLVRKVCDKCREGYLEAPESLRELFGDTITEPLRLYKPKGCPTCNETGYGGRVAIHEVYMATEATRALIGSHAPIQEIQAQAEREGYKPMHYDGVKKALRGLTTLMEIDKATTA